MHYLNTPTSESTALLPGVGTFSGVRNQMLLTLESLRQQGLEGLRKTGNCVNTSASDFRGRQERAERITTQNLG